MELGNDLGVKLDVEPVFKLIVKISVRLGLKHELTLFLFFSALILLSKLALTLFLFFLLSI